MPGRSWRRTTVVFICIFITGWAVSTAAATLKLRRTGQIKCWQSADPWGYISCAGTGQDGDVRAGIPIPDPHFTDNGDGTMTDNATGLVWLQDIDCMSDRTWGEGLADVALLADGQCGLSDGSMAGDWRMPNAVELESLYNGVSWDLRVYLLSVGFSGTRADNTRHWSSTTNIGHGDLAYTLGGHSYAGHYGMAGEAKNRVGYVLAVRGSTATLRKSGQTTCYDTASPYGEIPCTGTGQDGEKQAGVAWPAPRFTDNGDGTVTDELTGLVWLQKANCFGGLDSDAALAAAAALADGQCGLSDGSAAGQWRVPNRTELVSLLDYGQGFPKVPAGHLFANVPTGYQVGPWSSTIFTSPQWSWYVVFGGTCCGESGNVSAAARSGPAYPLWPVRDGAASSFHPDMTVIDDVDPSNDLVVDCGDQTAGSARDHTVTLRNDGGADLTIGTVAASDPLGAPFSIAADGCSNQTLAKEASCTITVRCAPGATSTFGDTFDIPSDDPTNPTITFAVGAHAVLCGDANDDGRIAATDALMVLKTAVGSNDCSGLDTCICNVDAGASVTATDALMVLKYAVGLPIALDCVC